MDEITITVEDGKAFLEKNWDQLMKDDNVIAFNDISLIGYCERSQR